MKTFSTSGKTFLNISNILSNQTIQFDASGSFDSNATVVSYEWNFGDGETDTGVTTNHTYKNPGKYTVTLIVTDNTGKIYSKSIIVTVAASAEEDNQRETKFPILLFNPCPNCNINHHSFVTYFIFHR